MTKQQLLTLQKHLVMLRNGALQQSLPNPLELIDVERIVSMQQLTESLIKALENNELELK